MKRIIPGFLGILFFAGVLSGQAENDFPRIGLVLSGGGAKGIAHAGVIKALEEYQIPIHCISGVSAGALIGGLYASGWQIDQLYDFACSGIGWDLLAGIQDRRDIPIENRIDALPEQVNIFLDESGSSLLPMGLLSNRAIKQYLQIQLLPGQVYSGGNFDSLAIPLRVVASDMVYQKATSFSHGNLAEIIRASMAYPIVFEPVFLDSTFYMDGGFYNNLPIQEARDMGADFIIAVNTSDIPPKKNEIVDVGDVFTYLNNVFAARSDSGAVSGYDYFIQINNPDVMLFDFLKGEEIFQRGYEVGLKAARKIRGILDNQWDTAAFHQKQETIRTWLDNRTGYRVDIRGNERFTCKQIQNLMAYQPGIPYSVDVLKNDMDRLYGSGYFNSVDVEASEIAGSDSLLFVLSVNENMCHSVQGGFYFDSNAGMNVYMAELNRQLFNTSLFLKNYLFAGNYHIGGRSRLTGIQSLKFPFINLRFTRAFQISAHRYQYDTNLFDSRFIRKNVVTASMTASASLGWDRLIQLEFGGIYGEYLPSQASIQDYIRRLNTDKPYIYAMFRYIEDMRTRLMPMETGYSVDITFTGGRSFVEEFHPVLQLHEYAAYFLKGESEIRIGIPLNRRMGLLTHARYGHIFGYPPILENIRPEHAEHLRYFIGEDLLTTDYIGGSLGTVYHTWVDNLWFEPQLFVRYSKYRLWTDVETFDRTLDYGVEISLIYNTILGPVTYGFVFHKEDNFGLNSWARIGMEF
ncbi:MAG: patatin-like phospholipase family protein [Candidatus Marinimicrobia bacterium]|nr:patatin-like phospholipase family protein [Candidatus Neomarinimicrobiota bacterium]